MSLSSDLLAQARFLVSKEPKRPKQASLRRAVSAAYYSLFHLLTEDAARVMYGGTDAVDLRSVVRRAFRHTTMKKVARGFGAGNIAEPWKSLVGKPSNDLQSIAVTFVELQEARHQADYDTGRSVTRTEVTDLVQRVENATEKWKNLKRANSRSRSYSFEARIFVAALLLYDQVPRP